MNAYYYICGLTDSIILHTNIYIIWKIVIIQPNTPIYVVKLQYLYTCYYLY